MIPVYNNDARRRIREAVHFTENFASVRRDLLRRGGSSPAIVAITEGSIGANQIGTCRRAQGSAFDSTLTGTDQTFSVWNPGDEVEANKTVIIEPVSLQGVGISWAIVAPFAGTGEAPGDAERILTTMEFSGSTPDTYADPTAGWPGGLPYVPVNWALSTLDGAYAKITPSSITGETVYMPGKYLVDVITQIDNAGVNGLGLGAYTDPNLAGHWLAAGGKVLLQYYNGSTWISHGSAAYAYCGPNTHAQTTMLRTTITVPGSELTGRRFRVVLGNSSNDSQDAKVRLFHAQWFSQPLK